MYDTHYSVVVCTLTLSNKYCTSTLFYIYLPYPPPLPILRCDRLTWLEALERNDALRRHVTAVRVVHLKANEAELGKHHLAAKHSSCYHHLTINNSSIA